MLVQIQYPGLKTKQNKNRSTVMFIANNDKSYIGYKNMLNNNVLVFNIDGGLIDDVVHCNDWQLIHLFEVPIKVLEYITNSI
jgi:hypothetical protein